MIDLNRLRKLSGLPVQTEAKKSVVIETANAPKRDRNTNKSLLDYLMEISPVAPVSPSSPSTNTETIGNDRNSAIKALQTRLGPNTTPQQAAMTLDRMKANGVIKQKGSAMQMPPMDDNTFKDAIDEVVDSFQTPRRVKKLSNVLTDDEADSLRKRYEKVGRAKLIDWLENSLINANLAGNTKLASRLELKIDFVRKMNG